MSELLIESTLPDPLDEWSLEGWRDYLRDHNLSELTGDAAPTRLTGGVSSYVWRVGGLVFKQPRRLLDVEEYWRANESRFRIEAEALRAVHANVPRLVHVDLEKHILVLEWVDGENWRSELMAGRIDPATAARVGTALAGFHAAPVTEPSSDGHVWELRYQPYFVRAAARNPSLHGPLMELLIECSQSREVLAHGDFSPKNVLVDVHGAVNVIDWEVAHQGSAAFDIGFLLSHLVAKATAMPGASDQLLECMNAFLSAYGDFDETAAMCALGGMLLARVDGASRLDYLDAEGTDFVRALGGAYLVNKADPPWRVRSWSQVELGVPR